MTGSSPAGRSGPGRTLLADETGVVVLGMHRSGTSATARLVNLLGVPIGSGADLKPPNEANVTGYWESNSLTAFNDRLLRFLGGSWTAPPILDQGWERAPGLASHRRQALRVFRCVYGDRRWVWKDPRTSVTLPFWLCSLGVRPVIVLSYRNPIAVARSLRVRYGIGKRLALAIWERYSRAALANVRGLPVFVLPYDALVVEPFAWCERLRSFLGQHGVCSSSGAAGGPAVAFIEPELRHHVVPTHAVLADPVITPEQREIVAVLEALGGEHDTFGPYSLQPEPRQIERLLAGRRQRDLASWSDEVRHGPIDRRFALPAVSVVVAEPGL